MIRNFSAAGDSLWYKRYAPGRCACTEEGKAWLFAEGQLAMTAQDLASGTSRSRGQAFEAGSYLELGREVLLKNGLGTNYGLGVNVTSALGVARCRMVVKSGFTAQNIVFPDDRVAGVCL